MIEEERNNCFWHKWIIVFFGLMALPITVNISASVWANDFGMTAPELMKEFYMVALYIISSFVLFFLIGHLKFLPEIIKFSLRLLLVVIAISACYNQIRISYELAGAKKEFSAAAIMCSEKSNRQLGCHGKIERVIAERQSKLTALNAIVVDDWQVKTSHDLKEVETSAIYFYRPF